MKSSSGRDEIGESFNTYGLRFYSLHWIGVGTESDARLWIRYILYANDVKGVELSADRWMSRGKVSRLIFGEWIRRWMDCGGSMDMVCFFTVGKQLMKELTGKEEKGEENESFSDHVFQLCGSCFSGFFTDEMGVLALSPEQQTNCRG